MRDVALVVCDHEDVLTVGDLFEVGTCPHSGVACHEGEGRGDHLLAVVNRVAVGICDDGVRSRVPRCEGRVVVMDPHREGAAEETGYFRCFSFESLGLLDDVDGASVTGDRASGASECGYRL